MAIGGIKVIMVGLITKTMIFIVGFIIGLLVGLVLIQPILFQLIIIYLVRL